VNQGGSGASATQNIQQPQASEPKDAFVASIMPIEAIAVAMMDTSCRQMGDPPHGEK